MKIQLLFIRPHVISISSDLYALLKKIKRIVKLFLKFKLLTDPSLILTTKNNLKKSFDL